jgi:hypothetical protein
MGQKYLVNYKNFIIIRFLLHQNIDSKIFVVDALLNNRYLLAS